MQTRMSQGLRGLYSTPRKPIKTN